MDQPYLCDLHWSISCLSSSLLSLPNSTARWKSESADRRRLGLCWLWRGRRRPGRIWGYTGWLVCSPGSTGGIALDGTPQCPGCSGPRRTPAQDGWPGLRSSIPGFYWPNAIKTAPTITICGCPILAKRSSLSIFGLKDGLLS